MTQKKNSYRVAEFPKYKAAVYRSEQDGCLYLFDGFDTMYPLDLIAEASPTEELMDLAISWDHIGAVEPFSLVGEV